MKATHLARKARTLFASGTRRQALVAEAFACLLMARVTLLVRRFPNVARRWGSFLPPEQARIGAQDTGHPEQVAMAREIGWAVRSTASIAPFKAVCLQQAMAAHAMLSRRGIASALHFGVARDASKAIQAHAWLDGAGVKLTGYPVSPDFIEIGCFQSRSAVRLAEAPAAQDEGLASATPCDRGDF